MRPGHPGYPWKPGGPGFDAGPVSLGFAEDVQTASWFWCARGAQLAEESSESTSFPLLSG